MLALDAKLDNGVRLRTTQRGEPKIRQQRAQAEEWLIRALQPYYRGNRLGHTFAEIRAMQEKQGDAPECSDQTMRRAVRTVLENVRDGPHGSYWRLKREHEY